MTRVAESFWRCDTDAETFAACWRIVAYDEGGNEIEPPRGTDVILDGSVPCPFCGGAMRRVVGILDFRDWEAQFA